jgi:choline dehydrogenase-like flavoprotein
MAGCTCFDASRPRDRVRSGLAADKARGVVLGRQPLRTFTAAEFRRLTPDGRSGLSYPALARKSATPRTHGRHRSDLDPTYKDHLGDPLLRLTIDWHDNENQMLGFTSSKGAEMARAMGAKEILTQPPMTIMMLGVTRQRTSKVERSWKSPDASVVNTWGQHWQLHNLFIVGASTMPCQGAANPTPTVLALADRTADALIDRYLKSPGTVA